MAANPTLPATGTGTADIVVATEEIAGAQLQRVKLAMGGSNVDSGNIASGAGAVGATVPRVTLASDDPAVTSLQVIDDWDESDRAKVNLIAGQAGITAGAGAVAANTPRVTHASDDPAVAVLGATGDAAITTDTTGSLSGKLRGLIKWAFERMPASLGQKAMSAAFPVSIASDQSAVPVSPATVASANNVGSQVTVTTSSTTLLASFSSRKGAFIKAGSDVFVKMGSGAATSCFLLEAGETMTLTGPLYTGIITAITAAGSATVYVMEW